MSEKPGDNNMLSETPEKLWFWLLKWRESILTEKGHENSFRKMEGRQLQVLLSKHAAILKKTLALQMGYSQLVSWMHFLKIGNIETVGN